jgi:glycyl-tRNA synthetase
MAHYAHDCWDVELFSQRFGWVECVGIADRSAYDLSAHMKATGVDMRAFKKYDEPKHIKTKAIKPYVEKIGKKYKNKTKKIIEELHNIEITNDMDIITVNVDGEKIELTSEFFIVEEVDEAQTGKKYLPHVIEPSYGIDRIFYFTLEHNFHEHKTEDEYTILSLPPSMAPIKTGVFPLVNKDGLPQIAKEIEESLRSNKILAFYDEGGSIGRRYARMDEIGTPFCITVDYQTKDDNTVTVRFRDSAKQIRISKSDINAWITERVNG